MYRPRRWRYRKIRLAQYYAAAYLVTAWSCGRSSSRPQPARATCSAASRSASSPLSTRTWSSSRVPRGGRRSAPIGAVFETHVQADHVSGLPALVEAGATAYLPAGATSTSSTAHADGEVVELGNTVVRALATPGHAPAHNAYMVADRRRGTEEPWLVFTGDSLSSATWAAPTCMRAGDPGPAATSSTPRSSACLSFPTTCSSIRATTAAPSVGAGSRATRSRASASSAATTRPRASGRGELRRSTAGRPAAGSGEPTEIVAANRRGVVASGHERGETRLGLRENAGQFAFLSA